MLFFRAAKPACRSCTASTTALPGPSRLRRSAFRMSRLGFVWSIPPARRTKFLWEAWESRPSIH
jgi:hypothetical protein